MRLLVTGRSGQVATALAEVAQKAGCEVIRVGRPELDLEAPESVLAAIASAHPDIVVSAAAWTAVDLAEREPERARLINEVGAGAVAAAAAAHGVPVIHLSTDYVYGGRLDRPWLESDATSPQNVYGATKLAGERAVALANPDHAILRTAWVFSAHGKNFVRTMLTLGESREEASVVFDQIGNPTYAADIADAIVVISRNLLHKRADMSLRGIFHMAGAGDASWSDFAEAIFEKSRSRGGPFCRVRRIPSADYPTPAPRPANSRLNCAKLERAHGVRLPHWRNALDRCLDRALAGDRTTA